MTKRIVLALAHSVEEWMQVQMLHSLGYEVASLGAYINPAQPHVDTRPPLPDVPYYPELEAAVNALHAAGGDSQATIPEAVLDWLGDDCALIFHHREERLFGQWGRIRDWMLGNAGRRVIWRTVGQSVGHNERRAAPYRMAGLERVAYSPKEANIPDYCGHDAIIRFWGVQEDAPWTGEDATVITIAQDLRKREPYTNWSYWDSATRDLPRLPIGPGSEAIGGTGKVSTEEMRRRLLTSRAFLFTGSQPASYTLGLIEALHAGIPVVSIGPSWMRVTFGEEAHTAQELFEGHELAPLWSDDPNEAHHILRRLLADPDYAATIGAESRAIARDIFDRDKVGAQWKAYLG